jgi:ribonuclease VapC
MVIDSCALVAILFDESDGKEFLAQISTSAQNCMSAASYVEIGVVLSRRFRDAGLMKARNIVELFAIEICDVTAEQAHIAQEAYLRYGKGLHPAGLNYGDCFVYALAKARREPVLCKGAEFGKTDIAVVV